MNTRFSTYASYWIKQSIKRTLVNTAKTIRLPAYMVELLIKWRRTDLVAALEAAGVASAPLYAMEEVFADEQIRHRGNPAQVEHPQAGPLRRQSVSGQAQIAELRRQLGEQRRLALVLEMAVMERYLGV